jgi:CMP-N,N'-diacetyllegionaminic acid synthase
MSRLFLIPARGGSKGIPRKNIVPLGGRPLIAWTIGVALESALGRVLVSTDSQEIAAVASREGAEVPFLRPAELAGDYSGSFEVAEHALKWVETSSGESPELLVLLQPTSPFRTAGDIIAAIRLVENSDAPAVIGVCEADPHPWMTRRIGPEGMLDYFVEVPKHIKRRQDYPPAFAVNGAIYAIRSRVLLEKKTFQPPGTLAYLMPQERSLDIDLPSDLQFAEWMATRR